MDKTEVREVMKAPLGKLGRAALALIRKFPAEELTANLRRLKEVMETGKVMDTSYAVAGKFSQPRINTNRRNENYGRKQKQNTALTHGAYGYTGRLTAEPAAVKKLDVVLAGRNKDALVGSDKKLGEIGANVYMLPVGAAPARS